MQINWIKGVAAIAVLTVFTSCSKEDQPTIDGGLIDAYIADNNLTMEKTDEGVYYSHTVEGTGASPTTSDDVEVHYKGYTLEGNIFDSSYDRDETSTFPLSGVIQGWQIGIPLMKEGGTTKLIIPSHLAYGNSARGSVIKKNEVLVFDIELIEVNP